ncbi:hypothetical protein [Desertivirga brevis]|uniref:hypothetical protein n=1 Tax=Desertivirga brevis TaxID=2810310 RepID=UPI001A95E4C8|nr:hypothetical protein [Pedobacter sp. SYSU D00873]
MKGLETTKINGLKKNSVEKPDEGFKKTICNFVQIFPKPKNKSQKRTTKNSSDGK